MELNDYQNIAHGFAIYPTEGLNGTQGVIYTIIGLNGEAGEAADHTKKIMRDDGMSLNQSRRNAIALEIGDALWYVACCARELGFTLEEIAHMNVSKLQGRRDEGTIRGDNESRVRAYEEKFQSGV
jgi:NTP pyrophosphatase (non-canonical NTP hydrolase)